MSRLGRLLLAALVALGVGFATSLVPDALARVEKFQVQVVRYEGGHFLTRDAALAELALGRDASVWDDLRALEEGLRQHPLVAEVSVTRDLPDTLVVTVRERQPVAFYPFTTLEPVDDSGQPLPVDPVEYGLDLPLLHPELAGHPGELLTPGQRRILAEETGRLARANPQFMAQVSQLTLGDDREVVAMLSDLAVEIRFRAPLAPRRLIHAESALRDALVRFPDRMPREVDLRFEEQVVLRFHSPRTNAAVAP
jgi:cell division septal protein FtsQ